MDIIPINEVQSIHASWDLFWIPDATRKNGKVSLHFWETWRIVDLACASVTAGFLELKSVIEMNKVIDGTRGDVPSGGCVCHDVASNRLLLVGGVWTS